MLFRFSLLLLFRDLAHVNADERGRESRIINGVEVTDPYKYDYIANVGTCGATLIAPNVLLSAAHCGNPTSVTMNKLKVAGSRGGRQTRESFRVIDVEDHPSFNVKGLYVEYDFRVIRINGYSQNTPVLLDDGTYESKGTELTVMGWGLTADGGSLSEYLMEVDVDVSDFAKCASSYNPLSKMGGMTLDTELHICAGRTVGGKTYDSCNGDSGGPLVKYNPNGKDTQVGVVSFGNECGNPDYPGVYAKVSYAKEWIEQWISDWDCTPSGQSRRRRLKKGGATPKPTTGATPAPTTGTTPAPTIGKKTDTEWKKKPTKKTKPPKATKTPTGTKKTKKPTGVKPSGSPSVSPVECPEHRDPAPVGQEWILADIEIDEPCGFLLDDDELKKAVALYKADPTASLNKYGAVPFWFVKDVTNFGMLFMDNESFNADVSGWDTSSATNMGLMFQGAKTFNQPIGKWNTAKVTAMNAMFEEAEHFNQDVSMWNVDKVDASAGMFHQSTNFNQDMCPWVNSETLMKDAGLNMIKLSGCDNLDKVSVASFCQDCAVCTDDSDCAARPCETGTCGSAGVCHYTLDRKNRLKINLTTGGFPEDAGYELTQDGKTVMFAKKLSDISLYEWNVDVCEGVHQMCLTDTNMSGSHKLDVTYFYNEKSVDDTNFPLTTALNESNKKCVAFTVTAM